MDGDNVSAVSNWRLQVQTLPVGLPFEVRIGQVLDLEGPRLSLPLELLFPGDISRVILTEQVSEYDRIEYLRLTDGEHSPALPKSE